VRAIVTLKYDDGLERAFSAAYSAGPISNAQDRAQLVRWQQGRLFGTGKLPILHWHGMPSDPGRMIFTADDYNEFYSDQENVEFVRQLWRGDRLLVVGFGFSDPFLVRVVEGALRALPSDNRHFALIGVHSGKTISPFLRRQFTKKYRLTPIFYQIRSDGERDDHSDLIQLLSLLREDHLNIAETASKSLTPAIVEQGLREPAISQAAYREFERGLLVSPGGRTLYVKPRLLRPVQLSGTSDSITYESVGIDQLVTSCSSFMSPHGRSTALQLFAGD
jgi:SIR2-like domain